MSRRYDLTAPSVMHVLGTYIYTSWVDLGLYFYVDVHTVLPFTDSVSFGSSYD